MGVGDGLSGLFTTVALGWELDRRLLRREHPGACVSFMGFLLGDRRSPHLGRSSAERKSIKSEDG